MGTSLKDAFRKASANNPEFNKMLDDIEVESEKKAEEAKREAERRRIEKENRLAMKKRMEKKKKEEERLKKEQHLMSTLHPFSYRYGFMGEWSAEFGIILATDLLDARKKFFEVVLKKDVKDWTEEQYQKEMKKNWVKIDKVDLSTGITSIGEYYE